MNLDWHVDPLSAGVVAWLAYLYLRGTHRLPAASNAHPQRERLAFYYWLGWIALAVAFGPPLHALTHLSFAAHMAQHEILMLIAAPLFVLARPQGVLMWGLPDRLARGVAAITRSGGMRGLFALLVSPLGAWLLHLVVLWGWHLPAAFDKAVKSDAVHWLQHVSFFLTALLFWYSVLAPGRAARQSAGAVISLFATAAHTSLLGVLLTFSSSPWYRSYAQTSAALNLTALEDQQLGGLIMWVPGGVVFVVAALAIIATWLTTDAAPAAERAVTRRPV